MFGDGSAENRHQWKKLCLGRMPPSERTGFVIAISHIPVAAFSVPTVNTECRLRIALQSQFYPFSHYVCLKF
jgi:hypothetical protein